MITKIFIVRHTETIGNIEKRLTGRQDYEITPRGKELINKLTEELRCIKFDKMYSSPSQRAVKTIKPLSIINKIDIEKEEDLSEMYFGIYDGWKWEDVNKIRTDIKQNQNRINEIYGIDEQESMEQVAERMYNCITRIVQDNLGKTILIASHGVAIEAFIRKIVQKPFSEERERFCQYNVAINELEYEDGKYNIIQLANIEYLKRRENEER